MTVYRIAAVARKDAAELLRNPGAIVPAVIMVLGSLFPAFLVIVLTPRLVGKSLEQSGQFVDEAAKATQQLPELAALTGNALVQAFVFQQFSLLLLMVPIVAAMSLATHAVIGEKQSKALAAKVATPFLFSLGLSWIAAVLYVAGAVAFGEPGVWRVLAGPRFATMLIVLGPLVALVTLLMSVIVSSRANDPRSAQQITSLVILPVTAVFVAQLMGVFVVNTAFVVFGALGCIILNGILLWVGVQVFQRESILTRWK